MPDLESYDYELPKELIAQHPLPNRIDARLLVVDRQSPEIEHSHVRSLATHFKSGDCLVINDTRVTPARLVGYRTLTRGRWEGLFLNQDAQGHWRLLGKTRGKIAPGETVTLRNEDGVDQFQLRMLASLGNGHWAATPLAKGDTQELLAKAGRVPLPHYIRGGEMETADRNAYQTMFADKPGAVAAPTAGLHFTPAVVQALEQAGVKVERITLHVGEGTFRPVKVARLEDHQMHAEWAELSPQTADALNACRRAGGRIIAVGTTSARTLETAADAEGNFVAWSGETDLFIYPPYSFRGIDALMTNFHLPKSTLLVLVRTFGGDQRIQQAYAAAIEERYRFYSYGDAMLIL